MSVVTEFFPAAVNHLLRREPWARAQLAPYAGKQARLNVPPFSIIVRVADAGWLTPVSRGAAGEPEHVDDVTITVLPDAMPAVLQGGMAVAMKHVRIGGDAEFATTLSKLAEHLRWDPEEDLSHWLGDAPAYRLAQTARAALTQAKRASWGLLGSLADYLLDENPQWVRRQAASRFTSEVADLRDDVERLDKRLERLERLQARLPSRGASR